MQKRIIMLVVRTKRDTTDGKFEESGEVTKGVFFAREEAKERERERERERGMTGRRVKKRNCRSPSEINVRDRS